MTAESAARELAEELGNLPAWASPEDIQDRLTAALRAAEQRGIDKNAGLRKVADKTAKWLRRLELQAQNQAEANRGRFNSLADAAIADANNYAAVAKDIETALAQGGGKV